MAPLSADTATKVSTDAAKTFVDTYYKALNTSRANIASFYIPTSTMPDGKSLPVIVYNGNILLDQIALQKMFQEQIPLAHHEVQDYDCQVVNPHYVVEGTQGSAANTGKNMTILITISGYVKYGEVRSATMRGFSENIVLVPNPAVASSKDRHIKNWLIQSQNFRLVS